MASRGDPVWAARVPAWITAGCSARRSNSFPFLCGCPPTALGALMSAEQDVGLAGIPVLTPPCISPRPPCCLPPLPLRSLLPRHARLSGHWRVAQRKARGRFPSTREARLLRGSGPFESLRDREGRASTAGARRLGSAGLSPAQDRPEAGATRREEPRFPRRSPRTGGVGGNPAACRALLDCTTEKRRWSPSAPSWPSRHGALSVLEIKRPTSYQGTKEKRWFLSLGCKRGLKKQLPGVLGFRTWIVPQI